MLNLYAKAKDDSATNAHAVLAIYVVLYHRKDVSIVKEGGETNHIVN